MADKTTNVQELKDKIHEIFKARDWAQYHSPKNLAMDVAVEAAELMEPFLWVESKESFQELEHKRTEVEHEVADVAIALLGFCQYYNIDFSKAIEQKIAIIEQRYPVEKAKGNRKKYTEL